VDEAVYIQNAGVSWDTNTIAALVVAGVPLTGGVSPRDAAAMVGAQPSALAKRRPDYRPAALAWSLRCLAHQTL
jgi:hypothetical protein